MNCTTSDSIEGKAVIAYLGVITSEAIIGANVLREAIAGYIEAVGGRSSTYERVFDDAKKAAVAGLVAKGTALRADAIISIRFQYLNFGEQGAMMMVAAYGTAVSLGRSEADKRRDKEMEADETALYFVMIGDKERGPLSKAQLRELHSNGRIEPETMVRLDGKDERMMLLHLLNNLT